jgi:16S rRNA (guanine527-N7)-methyltransferase
VFANLLRRCCAVTDEQARLLEAHYSLLRRWNRVLNLTAIEDLEEAVERHYCESLFLAERIPDVAGLRVADVGSGAGFPGFPVAVFRPRSAVTLIEAHQRKAVFLREASRVIANVRVVPKRAEEVRESFDWVVSRAVSMADLGKSARHLGSRFALLAGLEGPAAEWGVAWDVIPIPGSRRRNLLVSRETA